MDAPVPLRSLLFAPGNEPRKIDRVAGFGADAVILDLEDAVPVADKVATRPRVRAALAGLRAPLVCVRVNGLGTGLAAGDVDGVVAPGLDAVVLPKAEAPADVAALDAMLAVTEARAGLPAGRIRLLPLVESARGVLAAAAIAAASPRVLTLAFGSADFSRDLELPALRGPAGAPEALHARSKLVVDARAAGRARPVDGPWLAVRDEAGFEADCRASARLGFQGRICIHPAQVPIANRVYAPDPDEVAFCRRVAEAFAEAERQGSAAITVDGLFVDYPVAERARQIVALAARLAARDGRPA